MRQPRNFKPDMCYHLVSRVANRAFFFNEEERTRFVAQMWRVAYFSCREDSEARAASGSHGGNMTSVSAERLDSIRRRRREEFESALPDILPKVLQRGNRRISRDILKLLEDGPRRPSELRGTLGIASANYFTARYLTPLSKSGFIKPAGATLLHSSTRSYAITDKGRQALG